MKTRLNLLDIINYFCISYNNIDFYYGFDKNLYYISIENDHLFVFYTFRFSIFNENEIDMWYKDAKLHTFTDKHKLISFFKSLKLKKMTKTI